MHAIILAALCALALSQGAPTCGPNTHFNDCASACPKTCDDPNPTMCVMMCVSTCECDDGYLLNSDSTCVPAEACLPASTEAAPATSGAASSGAPMPGGHSPVDATSELVMQAATCAIAQWNAENSNNLAQQLSHIVAGTQQVVAGVLYNLVLATSPVGCVDDCPTQLMAAQIWLRPWLTESCVVQNITLIDAVDLPLSTAAPAESTVMPETSTEPASSDSATASSFGGAPGGPRPLDPSSASAVQAALCAVSALNAQSNAIYQLQLVRIVSGTSQVVSGARYSMRIATGLSTACRNDGSTPDLQRCPVGSNAVTEWDVSVVVQPWKSPSCSVLSTAAVVPPTAASIAPSQSSTETTANAQSPGPLVGGQQPLDLSSVDAQQAALCAVSTLNAQSNSLYQLQLVSIVSGTSQIVAGTRYRMRIATGLSTTCRNDGSTPNLQRCPVGSNAVSNWDIDVVVQPWQTPSCNVISTTAVAPASTTSAPASTAQPLAPLGSAQPLDINSAAGKNAALCAVSALNTQSNSIYQLQLVRIVSGTSQLVAGTRYAMRIATGLSTTCRNDGSTPDLQHCPVGSNAVSEYDVVVLVQPWQTPSCNVLSTTAVAPSTPTPMVGGSEPVDVASTEVTDAAVCAVAALNARSNSVYQLELVDVITGTQQVVAGMRYHLTMTVASAKTCLNNGATPSLATCPVDLSTAAQYTADVVVTPWATPSCTVLAVSAAVTGDQSMGVFTGSSSSSSSSTSPALWAAVGIATALIVATGVVYVVRARAQRVSPPSSDALGERLLQDDS